MTTREDFEKWFADSYGIDISIDRAGEGYIYDQINDKWIGYQACAAQYEAKIALYEAAELYDEAPDDAEFEPPHPIFQLAQERDNYADQVRNLLALIAEKDKALDELAEHASWGGSIAGYQKWISGIAQQALSLTHDSVMLKEVGSIKSEIRGEDGAELHYAKLNDHYPIDMKLYTIVKGAEG